MTDNLDYDLFVIGAGSGGVRASRLAAQSGAKVAIAEHRYLGGTCVNVGCVPKKLFVYASQFSEAFRSSRGFGWNLSRPSFDWATLRDNKNTEITRLNAVYGELLKNSGVTVYNGKARLLGPDRIEVDDRLYSARHILLANGGHPFVPDIRGIEHAVTSDEMFYLDQLPNSIAIVGGGYIAVEFAGIMHGLGVETHLIYRRDLFLRGFDDDLREYLAEEMSAIGIHLQFSTEVESIQKTGRGVNLTLNNGAILDVGLVMYATGRRPNTQDLGLENTAVKLRDDGAIVVDDLYQTAEPSIYALGDVIGRVELTPVAIAEAMALHKTLFENIPTRLDYSRIPTAVFSHPELACVGFTEAEARENCGSIKVFKSRFKPLLNTLGGGESKTFIKLIVDASSDRVVGCHMLGEHAAEIIQGMAIAMQAGATKSDFDRTIGIHPSAAEEFVTLRTES